MVLLRVVGNEFPLGLYTFQRQPVFELRTNQLIVASLGWGSFEMNLQPETEAAAKAAEILVEVIGPDGLVHHVGPFKSRNDARAWIARNSPDETPALDKARRKFATDNRSESSE